MDRFIRIEVSVGGSTLIQFKGELLSSRPLLVDTIRLFDLATSSRVSTIRNYPHYVEPSVVLVQRLLNQSDVGTSLNAQLPAEATVALTISRDAQAVFASTLLQIRSSATRLSCRLVSKEGLIKEASSPAPLLKPTVACAVVWAVNSTMGLAAELPIALSSVPIRKVAGQKAFVRIADVPEFARIRFCQKADIRPSDLQIDASVWKKHLRVFQEERICEFGLAQEGPRP